MLAADAFGPTPTIDGPVVTLRPLGPEYLDAYLPMLFDPESAKLTGPAPVTVTRETALAWLASRAEHTDRVDFAVTDTETGAFLGETVLNDFDPDNASANFRIALAGSAVFGRGYGTAATAMTLDYGFGTVGLHRIHLEVFDFNPRARRVYEKCGFRHEGTLRDAHHDDGGWHNVIGMAVLATDPR